VPIAAAACGAAAGPRSVPQAGTLPPTDSADRPDDIAPALLNRFGCDDLRTVCVNACTGRRIDPSKVPLVTEGQLVKIRVLGWESCRPEKVSCTSERVAIPDTSFRPQAPTMPSAQNTVEAQKGAAAAKTAQQALGTSPDAAPKDKATQTVDGGPTAATVSTDGGTTALVASDDPAAAVIQNSLAAVQKLKIFGAKVTPVAAAKPYQTAATEARDALKSCADALMFPASFVLDVRKEGGCREGGRAQRDSACASNRRRGSGHR